MGPQKTLVPISFSGGLDTKTDPKQVLPGKLLALQNGVFQQTGALARRWGYKALGTSILGSSSAISAAKAVNAFGEELLLYDGMLAYSYLPSLDAWASRGSVVSVIQSQQDIVRNTAQQLSPDCATLSGVTLTAWEDSRGGIRYSVTDATKGTFLVVDQPLYTGMPSTLVRPKVIAFSAAQVFVVFFGNASGQLCYVTVSPGAPARANTFANVLQVGLATPVFYDVAISGSSLFVTYWTATAFVLLSFSQTYAIAWTATVASPGSAATGALNVAADASGNAWVTYGDTGAGATSCSTAVYSSAGAVVLAPVQVIAPGAGALDAVAAIVSGTTATIYAEAHASVAQNQRIYQNTLTRTGTLGAAAASAPVFRRSVGLASKPFSYAGATYVNVAFESAQQSTYFTLDA